MPRRDAVRLLALAVSAFMLAACADYSSTGTQMAQSLAAGSEPSRFSERVTDPALAAQLDNAPAEAGVVYRGPDGSRERLLLGPPYLSARGITCRVGHPGREEATHAAFGIFAFCRAPDGWYKTRPILLSNR